jgi:hypothetical protein
MRDLTCGSFTPDVRIGPTDVGRGVFVTRDFAKDEQILVFDGPIIDYAATLALGERECDAFQVGPDRYILITPPAVCLNHSCEPNTGIRHEVHLVALRDIRIGEEIRFDYSTTMNEGHWEMPCSCGAPTCRGLVRDFKWLSRERKLHLLRQGIVPRFILESELIDALGAMDGCESLTRATIHTAVTEHG